MMKLSLGFVALSLAVPAMAAEEAPVEVKVAVSDIDMGSDAGLAEFDRRLLDAGRQLCRRTFRSDGMAPYHYRDCRTQMSTMIAHRRAQMLAARESGDKLASELTLQVTLAGQR